ncbi:hypothetical protein D3C76_696890 [compost metagenome]
MWIMLKDAFFSIVDKADKAGCLVVRARRQGDIERYFPQAKVQKTVGNDYLFRAEIPREDVAERIAQCVMDNTAPNFKNSVTDRKLHTAYNRIWHVMADLQPVPPFSSGRNRRQGSLL